MDYEQFPDDLTPNLRYDYEPAYGWDFERREELCELGQGLEYKSRVAINLMKQHPK